MTPCCPVGGYKIFGGANRLEYIQRNLPPTDNRETNLTLLATFTVTFLHDRHNSFSLIISVTMKMEAETSYETSVSAYDPTLCQHPEDHHLSNVSNKSLKIYITLQRSFLIDLYIHIRNTEISTVLGTKPAVKYVIYQSFCSSQYILIHLVQHYRFCNCCVCYTVSNYTQYMYNDL